MARGAEINAQDFHGKTPLYWAAYVGRMQLVMFLLSRGADANIKSKDGFTPLGIAEATGWTNIVILLEEHMLKSTQSLPDKK